MFDAYVQILSKVDSIVQAVLKCNSPDWRLHNACPACMYRLKDERPLLYKLFYEFDSNDSLKCAIQHTLSDDDEVPVGPVNECPSMQKVKEDQYLLHEYVDEWANATMKELLGDPPNIVSDSDYGFLLQ